MSTNRPSLGFVAAAFMALIVGGSAAVVAQGSPRDFGTEGGSVTIDEMAQRRGGEGFFGRRGRGGRGGRGAERGRGGFRVPLRHGLGGNVIRTETIVNNGDAGFVTHRSEQGEVSAASDSSVIVSLANGESSEIVVTDETVVLTVGTRADTRRRRLFASEGSISDVAAGDAVMVTSRSSDGGPFEASRIIVMAPFGGDKSESDPADAAEAVDATSASVQMG